MRGTTQAVPWHSLDPHAAAERLGSDPARGLAGPGVERARGEHGANVIPARRGVPWWVRVLRQFNEPLVYLLLVAAGVAGWVADVLDAVVILAVVLVNAAIGFAQESRAVRAIDALARSFRSDATVIRDGARVRLDAADVVPGDLVVLEAGDRVPADARLVEASDLSTDTSMLTGESVPVMMTVEPLTERTLLADRRNIAYAGSLVTRGSGVGVVFATGLRTEVGRISTMIASAPTTATPLTKKIAKFSKLLLWVIMAVAAATFFLGLLRGHPPAQTFMAAVALAVGAIPEGLPAAVTIMLAVGVSQMSRRRALIRKLPAVEALGSTTVICSDKTGTLTQNQMTVRSLWTPHAGFAVSGEGYDPAGRVMMGEAAVEAGAHPTLGLLLRCGALCNDAALLPPKEAGGGWAIRGDPTEAALLVAARKAGLEAESLLAASPRERVVPFDPDRQYMATLHAQGGERVVYVKGSVERVTAMCTREGRVAALDGEGGEVWLDPAVVTEAAQTMAGQGQRVLAFAVRRGAGAGLAPRDVETAEGQGRLTLIGLQGMLDPPRAGALEAVRACQGAGIRVAMITGDHAATARAIARALGITGEDPAEVVTGAEMARLGEGALEARAETGRVFARMTPEQKLRLVGALQKHGHVVAMTGDGVNDAPALRRADIGIAMGLSGTEVAKQASDMVLADDNFDTIRAAVEEGRAVYSNLTKFIAWTLPTNAGEALVIFSAIAMDWPLPILPVHALYINMTTAVLLGMPLVFERKAPDIMSRPPRDPSRPLLTYELVMRTGLVTLLLSAATVAVFHAVLARGAGLAAAQTAAVSVIVTGEVFYLFSSRALLRPAYKVPLLSNPWLWAGIGAMAGVHALFVYTPGAQRLFHTGALPGWAWVMIVAAGAAVFLAVEAEKLIRREVERAPDLESV